MTYIHDTIAELAAETFIPGQFPEHLTPQQCAAIQEAQTLAMAAVYRSFTGAVEWWSSAEQETLAASPEQLLEDSHEAAAEMACAAAVLRNLLSFAITLEDVYLEHAIANTKDEALLALLYSLKTLTPNNLP